MGHTFKPGDILGFSGTGIVSGVIQLGTFSLPGRGLSHVGIVGRLHGEPLVYESTSFGRPPCARCNQVVSGVQAHRLDDLLEHVKGDSAVWHYPLRRELYAHEEDRLGWFLDSRLGTPYDMPGAVRSGGFAFNLLQTVIRKENLNALFCSELTAAAHVEIGIFKTKSVSRWNPNKFVRAELRQGVLEPGVRLI